MVFRHFEKNVLDKKAATVPNDSYRFWAVLHLEDHV